MTSRMAQLLPLLSLTLWSCAVSAAGEAEPASRQAAGGQAAQGGAAAEQAELPARAQVQARAAAYLDALKLNDWHTAYGMHLAALDGSLTPLAFMQHLAKSGAKILRYEIVDVAIDRETGKASVGARVTYVLPQLFKPYTTSLQTEWVLRDGQLYRGADNRVPQALRDAAKRPRTRSQ